MSQQGTFGKAIVIITVITAAIMELIDTSIVNVALNQISGSLGATIEDVAWVITSYAIANVIIIPLTGFLSNYFGRKNYYVGSIVIFTVASYLCGFAENLWMLVIFRFLQGIGGGALLSVSQGILFDSFTIEKRPMASAFFGMGIVLGPTLGPTLGGIIIDNYHWSWIFYINVPIGILAGILAYTFIEKKENEHNIDRSKISIDYFGLVLLSLGIGSLQYVLERGETDDWFESKTIIWLTLATVVGLGLFIYRELKSDRPLIDLKVMKNRNLSVSAIFTFVAGYGLFTSVFVYPLLVQRVGGYTPTMTGVSLIFGSLIAVFVMPIAGRLMSKGVSPRYFVIIGILFFAGFSYVMSQQTAETSATSFMFILIMRGIGISMLTVPLINQAVSDLKPHEMPAGFALTNMIRQIGGSLGIAITNTFIAHRFATHRVDLIGNVSPDNPIFNERNLAQIQALIGRGINALDAPAISLKMMDIAVTKQAYLLSYLDTFQLVGIFFLSILPLTFFLKNKKLSAEEVKKAAEAAH